MIADKTTPKSFWDLAELAVENVLYFSVFTASNVVFKTQLPALDGYQKVLTNVGRWAISSVVASYVAPAVIKDVKSTRQEMLDLFEAFDGLQKKLAEN